MRIPGHQVLPDRKMGRNRLPRGRFPSYLYHVPHANAIRRSGCTRCHRGRRWLRIPDSGFSSTKSWWRPATRRRSPPRKPRQAPPSGSRQPQPPTQPHSPPGTSARSWMAIIVASMVAIVFSSPSVTATTSPAHTVRVRPGFVTRPRAITRSPRAGERRLTLNPDPKVRWLPHSSGEAWPEALRVRCCQFLWALRRCRKMSASSRTELPPDGRCSNSGPGCYFGSG